MMPRDAHDGHLAKFDDGAALQKIRACFHTQQNKKQTIGLSEDEMILKLHDDKERLQKAIDKDNIRVHGRFCKWVRDIHEDIAGGTHSFKF